MSVSPSVPSEATPSSSTSFDNTACRTSSSFPTTLPPTTSSSAALHSTSLPTASTSIVANTSFEPIPASLIPLPSISYSFPDLSTAALSAIPTSSVCQPRLGVDAFVSPQSTSPGHEIEQGSSGKRTRGEHPFPPNNISDPTVISPYKRRQRRPVSRHLLRSFNESAAAASGRVPLASSVSSSFPQPGAQEPLGLLTNTYPNNHSEYGCEFLASSQTSDGIENNNVKNHLLKKNCDVTVNPLFNLKSKKSPIPADVMSAASLNPKIEDNSYKSPTSVPRNALEEQKINLLDSMPFSNTANSVNHFSPQQFQPKKAFLGRTQGYTQLGVLDNDEQNKFF